jgi:hypothetical protein
MLRGGLEAELIYMNLDRGRDRRSSDHRDYRKAHERSYAGNSHCLLAAAAMLFDRCMARVKQAILA